MRTLSGSAEYMYPRARPETLFCEVTSELNYQECSSCNYLCLHPGKAYVDFYYAPRKKFICNMEKTKLWNGNLEWKHGQYGFQASHLLCMNTLIQELDSVPTSMAGGSTNSDDIRNDQDRVSQNWLHWEGGRFMNTMIFNKPEVICYSFTVWLTSSLQ